MRAWRRRLPIDRAGAEGPAPPAFYAPAARGRLGDAWVVLHPPYTAWHLSYVVVGASLAPAARLSTLVATLVAFFLAVGVAAHALDEWNGRPLGTKLPGWSLLCAGALGLAGALALGALGVARVGPWLVAFMVVGTFLVVAYDLELLSGRLHTDWGFAASWGSFPVLCAYFAESRSLGPAALAAAAGAFGLSLAQRRLSTPARRLRRQAVSAEAVVRALDGAATRMGRDQLLGPLEGALAALSAATVCLAVALALARFAG